jgi:nuclear pore complex protein Nup93
LKNSIFINVISLLLFVLFPKKVASLKELEGLLGSLLPDVLLAAMEVLFGLYSDLSDQQRQMKGQSHSAQMAQSLESTRAQLQQSARTLVSFAGIIPFRMPGDTNARLIRMQVRKLRHESL